MKKILFCCCFLIAPFLSFGQRALEKANDAYEHLEYARAIELYLTVLEKGDNAEAAEKLAHCYRLTQQYHNAQKWYARLLEMPFADPENRLYYAQMLLCSEQREEADRQAQLFLEHKPGDARGLALRQAVRDMELFYKNESRFDVKPAPFNTPDAAEFAPAWYAGGLVFSSDRSSAGDKKDASSGRSFTGLYFAQQSSAQAEPLRGEVNGTYHDAAACFSADGQRMYFTRNSKGKGRGDVLHLSLYAAAFSNGKWQMDGAFPYNSKEFSNGYPALSRDGKTLVFASDRPGSAGAFDLFMCKKTGDAWSEPQPLNHVVNTPGMELWPFLTDEGHLIFASDGHPGIGGLDLFLSRYENGTWQKPQNLGFPINSPFDDFSLISRGDLTEGWFASNRNNANGTDDVYFFKQMKPANELTIQVVDKHTRIPLPDVAIEVRDLNTGDVLTGFTNAQGQAVVPVNPNRAYEISGMKNGIATSVQRAEAGDLKPGEKMFAELEHNDPRFTLRGQCLDGKTKSGVAGVLVRLTNLKTMQVDSITSDGTGNFTFQLAQKADYQLVGEKDAYFTTVGTATTKGLDRTTTLYVKLYLSIDVIELEKVNVIDENLTISGFQFKPILYDYDKHNIRPDAAKELDKMVQILKLNPTIEIELRSHTDSRGKDDYNQALSQRRAESAAIYIIQKGIAGRRIAAKGFGETQLRNRCRDGVECSEKQHQENRRTEFVVLRY